jgi:hypothetical protein
VVNFDVEGIALRFSYHIVSISSCLLEMQVTLKDSFTL